MPLLSSLQQVASPEVMTQIANYYGNLFPMEIRYNLAEFLESKLFCLFAPNESHPQFENDARVFLDDFIRELETKAAAIVDNFYLPTQMRLLEAARNMRNQDPVAVYSHLIKCMSFEQQILENAEYNNGNEIHQVTQTVHQDIDKLLLSTRMTKDLQREWRQKSDAYRLDYHEMNQEERMEDDSNQHQQDVDALVRQLKQESLDMTLAKANEYCGKLIAALRENAAGCQNLTAKVIDDYLKNWKWYQKYDGSNVAINGADLDCIQSWCEKLAESLWNTREQIRITQSYQHQFGENELGLMGILTEMLNEVSNTLRKLINGSLIFEKQPPQVMKTNTKFTTTLRLLVGDALGLRISSPVVSAKIVYETQAQRIHQTDVLSGTSCGRILNGIKNFEFAETTRHMTVKFVNLKLDNFKRPTRRSLENVTDEKFALFFESVLSIGDFNIKMFSLSLPIVVIVHGTQECLALATIFWDNSFSDIHRNSFTVSEQVPFKQFADALNQKCINFNERGLTPENIHFLAEKLFKMPFPNGVPDQLAVSWNAFCKEKLQDREFSFWTWFHAALCVTRDHLRGPWVEGSIVGFMSKTKVEEYLKKSCHGTFLLRFSDSEPGAISIAWLRNTNVLHIQPFNSKDLSARSLSDRLNDLEELKFLCPNKPKSQAFDRYRSNEGKHQTVRPCYVPAVMKLVVFDDNRSQPTTTNQQTYPTTNQPNDQSSEPQSPTFMNL